MRKYVTATGILAAVAGCATAPQSQPHAMTTRFDPGEVAWFEGKGSNTLNGNAVLRTVGGDVRTCAGLKAMIFPVGRYAIERVTAIYGSPDGGYGRVMPSFSETDPRYAATKRETVCDSQGNFRFTDLPDGDYYVQSIVTWGVPTGYYSLVSSQGGGIAERVSLRGGETKSVVLTAQ